uniref:Probable antitoxin PhoAT n=1 Tax=Mycolicibacterium smegmatis (strain ATCC 700084 / mc(2)155) TaxID=246196 RepID=PHOAT_MYCS2
MASDLLCCPGGTDRFDHERTGPGPAAVSTEQFVWGRMKSAVPLGAPRD